MTESGGPGIPVIILARDEETTLTNSLPHVSELASRMIVVDSASRDSTVDVAKAFGAEILQFTWDGQYPKKKQWALDNSGLEEGEWVLLLDADEYPSSDLTTKIALLIAGGGSNGNVVAYDIPLYYRFAGKFLAHGHRVYKRSLFKYGAVRFPDVGDEGLPGITEVEGHYQPQAFGATRRIKERLVHDDRDPVRDWFTRHNKYSDWESHLAHHAETRDRVNRRRTLQGRLFATVPLKPLAFFLYCYVFRLGFLDGRAGFDYAFAQAAYYWQIGLKKRELQRNDS